MLAVIGMNTETKLAKKRGPKPSGVKKEVLFMRVPEGWRDRLKKACEGVLSGGEVDVLFDGWNKKASEDMESLGGREPEVKRESPVMVHVGADKMLSEYKNQNRMLLDDIQRLTDQVALLERELEECRNLTYDEKMACWKARALKAEAYAATKNE